MTVQLDRVSCHRDTATFDGADRRLSGVQSNASTSPPNGRRFVSHNDVGDTVTDPTRAPAVLGAARRGRSFDHDQPIGLLAPAVLRSVFPGNDSAGIVRRYRDALVSGGEPVVSHPVSAEIVESFDHSVDRFDCPGSGVQPVLPWWPHGPHAPGVGRKR